MMMFEYFVFDMDGTLVDTTDGIIASLQLMQKEMQLRDLPEETLRKFIGPPLKESFMKYYGVGLDETDCMTDVYRNCYMRVGIDRTHVFEGTIALLEAIRAAGCKCAIATLKQHQLASLTLKHTGIDALVDYVALNLDNSLGDKAKMIQECLDAIGCTDKSKAVMIGDSPYDGKAAGEAGVSFIPLASGEGFRNPGSLAAMPCAAIAQDSLQLKQIICKMVQNRGD